MLGATLDRLLGVEGHLLLAVESDKRGKCLVIGIYDYQLNVLFNLR